MRSDAVANRRRVLQAAAAVFAEEGPSAPTDVIARRAGVGIGTVFRHFPTKRDLVESVLLAELSEVTGWVQGAESSSLTATGAFLSLANRLAEHIGPKLAIAQFLFGDTGLHGDARTASLALDAAVARILRRAQAEGGIRADVETADVYFLLRGLVQPHRTSHDAEIRNRALKIILHGLRVAPERPEAAPAAPAEHDQAISQARDHL